MMNRKTLCVRIRLIACRVFLMAAVLVVAGCHAGLCIVDAEVGSVTFRKCSSTFREIPLTIDARERRLLTLQRTETNSLVVRWVGFDAKTQSSSRLPLFFKGYGGGAYAFFEDGQRLAYVKDDSHHLVVCATTNVGVNLLPEDVSRMWPDMYDCRVAWLNTDSLLVAPSLRDNITVPVDVVDLRLKRVRRICDAVESHHPILVSPSEHYLVVTEATENSSVHRLVVYDLTTYQKVLEAMPDGDISAFSVVWRSNDELLFAVGNKIWSQMIGSTRPVEVTSLSPRYGAWLYAVDKQGNLHYQRYDRQSSWSKPVGGWRVFNLITKEDREITRERVSGRVLISRDGGIVVAEVGM